MIHKSIIAAAALATSAMVPASAIAATTFDFSTGGTNAGGSSNGNVRTYVGSDGTKVEASAYSFASFLGYDYLDQSYLGSHQQGLGVSNDEFLSDNHTIDNSGWTDFIVLQFDKVVSVSSLGIFGFGGTDLTWAVGTTTTSFNGTLSFANLTALDDAFGTFNASAGSNNSTSYVNRTVNNSALTGNLFLVSASTLNSAGTNDSFKLKGLTANVAAVPEPATWGMMMIGLGLAGAMMRRSKANTAVSFA